MDSLNKIPDGALRIYSHWIGRTPAIRVISAVSEIAELARSEGASHEEVVAALEYATTAARIDAQSFAAFVAKP